MTTEKTIADSVWDGTERREHCVDHCALAETAKKSVPRWIYITTVTAALTLALLFAGIQKYSMDAYKNTVDQSIAG